MNNYSIRLLANAGMILTALIWGLAFVGQDIAMKTMQPMEFTASRFFLGAAVLTPFLFKRNAQFLRCLKPGLILGGFLAAGSGLQQQALLFTTVGNTAFITGLYAIFVPILGIFIHRRPNKLTFFACILATTGLYFISVTGNFEAQKGDILVVLCALSYATHLLLIDNFAKRYPPISLAVIQFYGCAVFCLIYSVIFESPSISNVYPTLIPILFTGFLSVGVAYSLQVIIQQYVDPTHAALILSMETVVGWLAGIFILSELVTTRTLVGSGLMLSAMIISIIANREVDHPPH